MKKIILFTLTILLLSTVMVSAQIGFDIEAGVVFSGYNDVRIPGDTGTKFSLSEDLEADTPVFYRVRVGYTFNDRNNISLLYAPLEIESTGQFENDVQFADALFQANTDIVAQYRFDSYRLTYRYDLVKKNNIEFGLGLTGKIRDAETSLTTAELTGTKTNTGFVPLINFRLMLGADKPVGFLLRGDALAAPQGRAEDILAAFSIRAGENLRIKLGYRILEGGADNDEVYTFALLHYAVLGVTIGL